MFAMGNLSENDMLTFPFNTLILLSKSKVGDIWPERGLLPVYQRGWGCLSENLIQPQKETDFGLVQALFDA